MNPSIKTNRMLWGRAASRCSICRSELVIDAVGTDDFSLVGEAAHIVAESADGPRGASDLTPDQRSKYANLILLCNVHHKQIDDHLGQFTVDHLKKLKTDHEAWVRTSLAGFDAARQIDEELWAGYVDEWVSKADLDGWTGNVYGLLQATPEMSVSFHDELDALRMWILSRVWPRRCSDIRQALVNFRLVVDDLVNTFDQHSEPWRDTSLRTCRFYRIDEWNPKLYKLLSDRFGFHVDLIHDLAFEMTRAANYVCDKIRTDLDGSFRTAEGMLLARRGMTSDLKEYTYRTEYRDKERLAQPYPGLPDFLSIRESRDFSFGTGTEPP